MSDVVHQVQGEQLQTVRKERNPTHILQREKSILHSLQVIVVGDKTTFVNILLKVWFRCHLKGVSSPLNNHSSITDLQDSKPGRCDQGDNQSCSKRRKWMRYRYFSMQCLSFRYLQMLGPHRHT